MILWNKFKINLTQRGVSPVFIVGERKKDIPFPIYLWCIIHSFVDSKGGYRQESRNKSITSILKKKNW